MYARACVRVCICSGVQVSTEAFVSTPSFLSYAPVFLKLCGQAADEHPPQRPETFEVSKATETQQTQPNRRCQGLYPSLKGIKCSVAGRGIIEVLRGLICTKAESTFHVCNFLTCGAWYHEV